ncbi:MAG: hypothetical protein D9V47_13260 [Clostridia bacterium]|nr:MAG: hypothetical protein D9V47_13260 [Clostridia bacterium]
MAGNKKVKLFRARALVAGPLARSPWWRRRRPQGWPEARLAAALGPLARRVSTRFALETVRLGLVWGLAAAAGALAVLYLTFLPAPVVWAGLAGAAGAASVAGWRLLNRPEAIDVVRIADAQGAGGRAVTAFRLLNRPSRDPWAEVAVGEGLTACAALEQGNSYPVLPSWRPWQGVIVLATVFAVLAFLPNPLFALWLGRYEAREALAEATRQAQAVIVQAEKLEVGERELLTPAAKEELQSLVEDLRQSGTREEAAAALEEAAEILEEAGTRAGPRAREDRLRLAAALQDMSGPGWQELGEALGSGDTRGIEEAAEAVAVSLEAGGKGAREEAAMAWLQQAEEAGDPDLRRELREAALGLMNAGPPGGEDGSAVQGLAKALSSLAGQAAAADSLAQGAATLGSVAQALAGGGNAMAVASAAGASNGNSGGAAGAGGNPAGTGGNPGGYGNSAGQGSTGGGASGGATGGAAGSGTAGNATSGGSGSGGGNGEGNASGSGQGDGAGKGTGGPASGGHGAGTSGGGLQMIYAPFLPGGTGEKVQVSGELREGEAGSQVTLQKSPVTLGEVRPYTEVYPQYRQEAQESLVQAPLPPAMEDLVWKYFTSLEPGRPEASP